MRFNFLIKKVLAVSSIVYFCPVSGQNFLNQDLAGAVGVNFLPINWKGIPFTDVNCNATAVSFATPDVTGISGPNIAAGIIGKAYSGTTFLSGLYSRDDNSIWHEGIMQTVTGLIAGESYSVNFYQANVKQIYDRDTSGSWALYINSTFIGISKPTISYNAFDDTSLIWEFRSFNFTASATSHTFKFIPMDDDDNQVSTSDLNVLNGGLRMGIDSIYLDLPVDGTSIVPVKCEEILFDLPNVFTPNGDGINDLFQPIQHYCFSGFNFLIYNRWGQIVYETNSFPISWNGKSNESNCTEGVYFWILKDNKNEKSLKGRVNLFR